MKLSTYKFVNENYSARLEGVGELTFVSNNPNYKDFSFDVDGDFLIEGDSESIENYESYEVSDLYRIFTEYYKKEGYLPAIIGILSILEMPLICCSDIAGEND